MVVKFYISMISGNKEMKKKQMKAQLIMESKGVEFKIIDICDPNCEAERRFMQKNAVPKPNARNAVPPQFFNEEEYCGDYEGFDDANENDCLEEFLKLPRGSLPQVPIINHNLSNFSSREVSLEKEIVNNQVNGSSSNKENPGRTEVSNHSEDEYEEDSEAGSKQDNEGEPSGSLVMVDEEKNSFSEDAVEEQQPSGVDTNAAKWENDHHSDGDDNVERLSFPVEFNESDEEHQTSAQSENHARERSFKTDGMSTSLPTVDEPIVNENNFSATVESPVVANFKLDEQQSSRDSKLEEHDLSECAQPNREELSEKEHAKLADFQPVDQEHELVEDDQRENPVDTPLPNEGTNRNRNENEHAEVVLSSYQADESTAADGHRANESLSAPLVSDGIQAHGTVSQDDSQERHNPSLLIDVQQPAKKDDAESLERAKSSENDPAPVSGEKVVTDKQSANVEQNGEEEGEEEEEEEEEEESEGEEEEEDEFEKALPKEDDLMEMSTTVATAERFTEFSYKQLPGED